MRKLQRLAIIATLFTTAISTHAIVGFGIYGGTELSTSSPDTNTFEIKVTDMEGNEKKTFSANETFKVLVPITSMTEEKQSIKINAYASIKTLPVYYGIPVDPSKQRTLLASGSYEDGFGEINEEYLRNKTKIIITKEDKDTKETLEGVEFQILDGNKKVILSGCKTNQNGQIIFENMLPGTYYVEEFKTINGYTKYDELIKVDLELNEEARVLVYNNKEVLVHVEGKIESDIVVSNKEVEQKEENKEEKYISDKNSTNKEITNTKVEEKSQETTNKEKNNTKVSEVDKKVTNTIIQNNEKSEKSNIATNKTRILPVAGM